MDKWHLVLELPFQVALISKPFDTQESALQYGRSLNIPCVFEFWCGEDVKAYKGRKIRFPLR